MFKRIMIAIDTSKIANLALKKAIDLAKEQKAHLCIVHVVDYSFLIAGGEGININSLRESTQKLGDAILRQAEKKAKKKKVKVALKLLEHSQLMSDVSSVVIQAAKKWRANLLVMGTHSYGGMNRFLLGSIADDIIRNTDIPILLIREKMKKK